VIHDRLLGNINVVIGVVSGVVAAQVLGILFAFCLCKAVGGERELHYHYKY